MIEYIDEKTVRNLFSKHWVFYLFMEKRRYILVTLFTPFLVWAIGAIGSIILGVFSIYVRNPLSYTGPLWIGLPLAAYWWFAENYPKKLTHLIPALSAPSEQTDFELRSWLKREADILINPKIYILLAGLPISVLTFIDIVYLWNNPNVAWIGSEWVQSQHPIFFALYFGFYDVLAMGFLLGSGVSGMFGGLIFVNRLFRLPLKIDYYRRLRAVGELSTGLAFWAFIAFVNVFIMRVLIKPNVAPSLIVSTLLLSVTASIVLFSSLLVPVLSARKAVRIAKLEALVVYEERLHEISSQIQEAISKQARLHDSDDDLNSDNGNKTQSSEILYELRKERDEIIKCTQEVENIPTWPISWLGILQLLSASFLPALFGVASDLLLDVIKP